MEEKSVKNGLMLIWNGIKMFVVCSTKLCIKSSLKALADTALGIIKHPLMASLIVGVIVYQFVVIAKQRVERDASAMKEYKLEQSLDSAKVLSEIVTYKMEHKDSLINFKIRTK